MFFNFPAFKAALICLIVGFSSSYFLSAQVLDWSDPASWPDNKVPESGENVLIPEGSHYRLDISPPDLGKLEIKGQLVVELMTSANWSLDQMIIDGGKLMVGQHDDPYTQALALQIGSARPVPAVHVLNGGELHLLASPETKNLIIDAPSTYAFERWMHIEESAGAVNLQGVKIGGYSITRGPEHALIYAVTDQLAIDGCRLENRSGRVLWLDGHSNCITNTLIKTNGAEGLLLSPAGLGRGNIVRFNRLEIGGINEPITDQAVQIGNPDQIFSDNQIDCYGCRRGLAYVFHDAYGSFEWEQSGGNFELARNTIAWHHNSIENGDPTVGLFFDEAELVNSWPSRQNQISGFDVGANIQAPNLLLDNWIVHECTDGLYLRGNRLNDVQVFGRHMSGGVAISVQSSEAVTPIWDGVAIQNFETGIRLQSPLKTGHAFLNLSYDQIDQPWKIEINEGAPLFFPHGDDHFKPLRQEEAPSCHTEVETNQGHSSATAHHHHHMEYESEALSLHPEGSWAVGEDCQSYMTPAGEWMLCPESSIGQLALLTGFGQHDPIHEHNGVFTGIALKQGEMMEIWSPNNDQFSIDLAANRTYGLEFDGDRELYDLQIDWSASPGESIDLRIYYPYAEAVVLMTLGGVLPKMNTEEEVRASSESAWYYDVIQKSVVLRIVPTSHQTSVTLYSEKVPVEIELDDEPIIVDFNRNEQSNKMEWDFELPPHTSFDLVLTDLFGVPVARTQMKASDIGRASYSIARSDLGLADTFGWYFLTVGEQTHKGAIYW
ncbi:MAG: G8 domain-containing protein [Bacteroidota bacterium]